MATSVQTIVAAVDFGPASARAVTVAGILAHACGATLRLQHAETLDLPPYFTATQIDAFERERQQARAQAEDYLRTFGQQHTPHPFSTAIVEGPAVEAIVTAARTADLVVMGTHGRRGVSRWWLGSVAERAVRESARPVLVVHESHEKGGGLREHNPLVLIGSEGPEDATPEREFGEYLARSLSGSHAVATMEQLPELARDSAAALVVVRKPWPGGGAAAIHQAERLLQDCVRPVLFVPA